MHLVTPLMKTTRVFDGGEDGLYKRDVFYKLESMQVTGSFKYRGLFKHIQCMKDDRGVGAIICSSAGNAGLAAIHAAYVLGLAGLLVVPDSTPDVVINRLEEYHLIRPAELVYFQYGNSWAEANVLVMKLIELHNNDCNNLFSIRETCSNLNETKYLELCRIYGVVRLFLSASSRRNLGYVSPFDHQEIWEGHSSIVDELKTEFDRLVDLEGYKYDRPAAILVSVGGGGLCLGVMKGLAKNQWDMLGEINEKDKQVHVFAIETEGAASYAKSCYAGKIIRLTEINTIAKTLGVSQVTQAMLPYILDADNSHKITSIVVTDAVAALGVVSLYNKHNIMVEPSCGCAIAAVGLIDSVKLGAKEEKVYSPDDLINSSEVIVNADSKYDDIPERPPIVVICCGGSLVNLDLICQWAKTFNLPLQGPTPSASMTERSSSIHTIISQVSMSSINDGIIVKGGP